MLSVEWFFSSLPPPPPSTFRCLSVSLLPVFVGLWGLVAWLSGFASHWYSLLLELAVNSGSSRMSEAPNLHLARQLLICPFYE